MLLFGWSEGMYIGIWQLQLWCEHSCKHFSVPAERSPQHLLAGDYFLRLLGAAQPSTSNVFSLFLAGLSWTKVKDSSRHPLCMTLCHLVLPLLTLRKLRPLPPPGTSLPEDWAEHSADSQAVLNLPENSIVGIRVYFDWGDQVHEEEGHWEHQPCTFCHKEVHAPPSQS